MIYATELDFIRDLLKHNPSMITFGRTVEAFYPRTHEWVMSQPPGYQGEYSFNERLYAILNQISSPPRYSTTGELRRFINFHKGYRKDRLPKVETVGPRALDEQDALHHAAMVGSDCLQHGFKVRAYLRRNRKHNAALYELPDDLLNTKFVICPVLRTRMLNIKKPYIEGVLLMTEDEFDTRYPDQPKSCEGHASSIATGLAVEVEPGVSRHQRSVVNATRARAVIGEDGLSINQRKGMKTRATHMRRDENGLNGYQKIAAIARPKQRATMAKEGKVSSPAEIDKWTMYRYFVDWLTTPSKKSILDGRPTGRAGTLGAYQVDHKYPVIRGFNNKISPWVIANRANLQAITWEENAYNKFKIRKDEDELLTETGYTRDDSEAEFNLFFEVWRQHKQESTMCSFILERFNEVAESKKKYPL